MTKRTRAEAVLLWRARGRHGLDAHRDVSCAVQQIGEGVFELRVLRGSEPLLVESFDDPERLLGRAEQLRAAFQTAGAWASGAPGRSA